MGLRDQAERDLGFILEDSATGFGWPITLTTPNGSQSTFTGFSDDIAQAIDPDTGQAVSGRYASAALRLSSLYLAGFSLPQGIADASSAPWLVTFNDINGLGPYVFKVQESNPDRALGIVTLLLESFEE